MIIFRLEYSKLIWHENGRTAASGLSGNSPLSDMPVCVAERSKFDV